MSSLIVNCDTTNSEYFENSPLTTFRNVSNVSYLMPNSFQTRIKLPSPLYWVYKIYLKSLELPVLWNNIRSTSNLNTIGIYSGLDASGNKLNHYQIIIPDGYYSTISDNLSVNGSVNSYNMNVSNDLSVANDTSSKLYSSPSNTVNLQTTTLATQTYANGMDGTGANTGLQVVDVAPSAIPHLNPLSGTFVCDNVILAVPFVEGDKLI